MALGLGTLGILATVGGAACTLLSSWVKEKELDAKITKQVQETLEHLTKTKES